MKIFKFSLLGALLLFVLLHISCTLIYVLPQNVTSPFFFNKAKAYMGPVFDQSWSLFAPVPEVNKTVFLRYENEKGSWSNWYEPFLVYQFQAYANRLSTGEKMVLAKSNTLHYIYQDVSESFSSETIVRGETNSGYYKVLQHLLLQDLRNRKIYFKKVELMLLFENVKNHDKHCIYYPAFASEN